MKINKLTILSVNNNIANCLCDCGNIKDIKYNLIISNKSKSCKQCPRSNLYNKRFDRLLVLNYDFKQRKWKCQCDCGKIIFALSKSLKNKNTKSCGCSKSKRKCLADSSKKVYRDRYKDGNLSFEDFLKLSQQSCYYCGDPPGNKTGNFIYNGLDRVNPLMPHNKDNVVTCCKICNRFKSNLSLNDFLIWLNNIDYYKSSNIVNLNKYQIFSLKKVWICQYKKELDFDSFIYLTQQNCVYCGKEPSNIINRNKYKNVSDYIKENSFVKYSTLDRIDNDKNHSLDNVVSACTHCNRSKNNLSVENFYNHVNKIKKFIKI